MLQPLFQTKPSETGLVLKTILCQNRNGGVKTWTLHNLTNYCFFSAIDRSGLY
jgi:hypothetical protein